MLGYRGVGASPSSDAKRWPRLWLRNFWSVRIYNWELKLAYLPACSLLPSSLCQSGSDPSMSLTRNLPIRSVGFLPTNAVHPPAS